MELPKPHPNGPQPPGQPQSPLPTVSLPTSGGSIRSLGEKFAANPVTGTATMTIPLATSPGRTGFGPSLSLTYDSGNGNGPFGFGWSLSVPSITRKTSKGIPRYMDEIESDVFVLVGVEDLVPVLNADGSRWQTTELAEGYVVHRYRPRVEGGTSGRLERWTSRGDGADVHWRHYSAENVLTRYGVSDGDRICDPVDPTKIFGWLVSDMSDCKGNAMLYTYKREDGSGVDVAQPHQRNRGPPLDVRRTSNRYLKSVVYGNKTPLLDAQGRRPRFLTKELVDTAGWMFEAVLDYGEHDVDAPTPQPDRPWAYRPDAFSTYKPGFEVRTTRLCRRLLMFHHFPDVGLVRSTDLTYSNPGADPAVYTFLTAVQQSGYRSKGDRYLQRRLPPVEFQYSPPTLVDRLEAVDESVLENLPAGLATPTAQFVDLYGEGLAGVMVDGTGGTAWLYKRNESPLNEVVEDGVRWTKARFGALATVVTKPNASEGASPRLADLGGDGRLSVVQNDGGLNGFYKSDGKEGWHDFHPFSYQANVSGKDKGVKMVDLTGDGLADLLVEDEGRWYESAGESGFRLARDLHYSVDEEDGPVNVFSDSSVGALCLADLSGDGLTDIIRIRNGEVCYWPNLGYGRFGAKVTMDGSPWFCEREQFDVRRIVLADVDGSGTTDILYLHRDGVRCYFNESGNGWSAPTTLDAFPPVADEIPSVQAVDLVGNGTSCLVFSTPLPPSGPASMSYIPLMGAQKPHLLTRVMNGVGASTTLTYAPSTKFYLQDKRAGTPWISRLPFPVQCLESVVVEDHIAKSRFGTTYSYHHGFYDGREREFRGFGMVEERDVEDLSTLSSRPSRNSPVEGVQTPAVHTKTWFHQGVWVDGEAVSLQFEKEYFRPPGLSEADARTWLLPDTVMPDGLTGEEERDACRALKGKMLRQEVYSEAPPGAAKEAVARDSMPFTVSESNFTLQRLQPRASSTATRLQSAPAVFTAQARETISHTYERSVVAEPRIRHSLVLQANEFGQVQREVGISYGRASPDIGLPTEWDRDMQGRTVVTYKFHRMTNGVDDMVKWPFMYRVPVVAESSSWEITGLPRGDHTKPFTFDDFSKHDFALIESTPSIPYEKDPDPALVQKRLFQCTRTLFRSDALAATLPLGAIEPLAIPGNNYQLAFAGSTVETYLRRDNTPLLSDPVAVLTGKGVNDGGYVRSADMKPANLFPASDPDDEYWIPSGESFFSASSDAATELQDARKHFFLPVRFRSPFGVESRIRFDDHDLLLLDTEDFIGNRRTVGGRDANGNIVGNGNDYRVLRPRLVTDMNLNRAVVLFDALGEVVATAVQGKDGEGVVDDVAGVDPDLDESVVLEHLKDPTAHPHALLLGATTRTLYDAFAYLRTKHDPQPQPAVMYSLSRMTHQADLQPPAETEVHHSFSYTDGFGRLLQKKHQTNPGPVSKRDTDGQIMLDEDRQPVLTDTVSDPRWISSGWVVYNHKGLGITRFEPFFTHLHTVEFDVRAGISPVNFYDALERVPVTLRPDGTYGKNTFDTWSSAIYDPNDTVELDPRTDPDVEEYVAEYFAGGFAPPAFQTWLQRRQAAGVESDERDASQKALAHKNTPGLTYFDSLGRPFLTVAHRKVSAVGHPQDGVEIKQYTRVIMDSEGHTRALRDASVQNEDPLGRVVERMDYDMLGRLMRRQCMEKGFTWTVLNIFGQPMVAWNEKARTVRSRYDGASRLIATSVVEGITGSGDPAAVEVQVSRVIFGESHPEAERRNLRGKAWMDLDQAGAVTVERVDFKGNVVESTQRLCREYQKTVDWGPVEAVLPTDVRARVDIAALDAALARTLELETFTDQSTFDAMDRMVTATLPHNAAAGVPPNTIRMGYDVLSLVKIECNLQSEQENGQKKWTGFVDGIQYTADGRRTGIQYHNGLATTYTYDIHHKLRRQFTTRGDVPRAETLQDLAYTYDPVGNITTLRDHAKQTLYFRNVIVEPTQTFTYDSLYQLVQATGREHLGQPGGVPIPYTHSDADRAGAQPGDDTAMGTYREQYAYDAVGNMLTMKHESSDARQDHGSRSWTRDFSYELPSKTEPAKFVNKLSSARVGGATEEFQYDVHGNTTRFPHLGGAAGTENVVYDFMDQMKKLDLGGGGTAYYTYDGTGKRVRKVIEKGANLTEERVYLRGLEIFRRKNAGGDVVLERETVHVVDDKKRVAMVEIRNKDTEGRDRAPPRLIRYQLESHLGSGSVELDGDAKILSFEEYSPYGSTTYQGTDVSLETPKRYRFTGKERDEESGFNYHGARYYAPWLGRWCSADPSGTGDGVNLYLYCHANPVVGLDPTGKADEDFKELAELHNEVGEVFANKTPPAPLTPDPTPMSKDKYRQVANTENKRFRRNPPPETPLDLVDGRSTTKQPPPMAKGSTIEVSHHAGALEAHESGISRADYEKLPKERVNNVSGTAAVMDPHTGKVDLVSNHRGVQENALSKPALERARQVSGGTLTPEGLKQTAEYTQWVGENVPLSEANADLLRSGMPAHLDPKLPKPSVHAPVDRTITKEMVAEARHAGTDLFQMAATHPGRSAKALKLLGKAGAHVAAAVPLLGEVAGHASAVYSASQGDYVGSVLDEVGMIPVYGDALDLARAATEVDQAMDEMLGTPEVVKGHGDVARGYVKQLGGGETAQTVAGLVVETASKESGLGRVVAQWNFVRGLFQ